MILKKQPAISKKPDQQLIDAIVQQIVTVVAPRRIILFGSAAQDSMGPHSDLDLLVIMPNGIHRRQTAQKIYKKLNGLGVAKDIIVVTENDVQEYGWNPSLIIYPALQNGKELYRDIK